MWFMAEVSCQANIKTRRQLNPNGAAEIGQREAPHFNAQKTPPPANLPIPPASG
jgi:hypothetical protein